MQDAEELFYQSTHLDLRARRAVGEAKAGLQRQCFEMLHRVLEVDPHHAVAQYNLGVMYRKGEGVEKDAVQAGRWFRTAAVQGYALAQHNLGYMCVKGEGMQKDAVQAAHWYRKAAEQGYPKAQNLGNMYDNGEGVEKDAVQAVHWYRKAAVQGNAEAQNNLGCMYANGVGVQQNSQEAAMWMQKAADQGDACAHFGLGQLNEQQGDYQAALVHYRAGQAAVSPEEARNCIRRCVVAVVQAKQGGQKDNMEQK
jgi:TPR repeat protein